MSIKQRTILCLSILALIIVYFFSVQVEPAGSCYGPHISANIDRTQVFLNQTVTVTGQVCPPEENKTVRIAFTRPDYSFIKLYPLTDPMTGNFSATLKLDMAGYWNIFAIDGHICDRLFAQVTDPANPNAPAPSPITTQNYKPNWSIIGITAVFLSIGTIALYFGTRNQTRKISSLRLFIQIGLIFVIFVGVFVDHEGLPVPAAQIAPHEIDISTNVFGVGMPDGLPAPFFGCFYPCGRITTCVLWQVQAYIYPFFNVGGGWGVHYDSTGLERLAVVFGLIILASVILGRVWCGWVCPFGLYVDLMTRLRKALKIKRRNFSDRFNERFHQLSYLILALIIILSVVFASQALTRAPNLVSGTQKGGFVYTYLSAPFCQVCPMKPLCILSETSVGLMRTDWIIQGTTGQFWQLGYYITSTNLIILGVSYGGSVLFPPFVVQNLPLGRSYRTL